MWIIWIKSKSWSTSISCTSLQAECLTIDNKYNHPHGGFFDENEC